MERLSDSFLLNRPIPQEDAEQLYRVYPDLPQSHMSGCPSCGKNRGYGADGILLLDGVEWECNCHDQLQRHKHYLNAGIGAAYHYITWKDFHGDTKAYTSTVDWVGNYAENIESGIGLYIWGRQFGTGKTCLAAFALKELVMLGYRCYMTTFQNMLSSMKSGWRDSEYDKWYRDKIDSAQVLFIDDIGKETMAGGGFNNDFARQTLDSLMRIRTQQGRPTLFTSNLSIGELANNYGVAIVSLFAESTDVIEVGGSDYRPLLQRQVKGQRRVY